MPKNPDRTELVLGVVSPVGSDLAHLESTLSAHIKRFGYAVDTIRVSKFLRQLDPASLGVRLRFTPEYHRIRTHMDAGNRAREISGRGDILALHAASEIHSKRVDEQPLPETVHVVLSLKHPQEVTALRRIYGAGFFLVGLYTPRAERQRNLEKLDMSARQASELMKRDENEESEIGQQTSSTFYQSDVFLSLDGASAASFDADVERFVDLVFGDPFRTPTAAEHAMFLAFAGSLRSADLSRQVGAVVVSAGGEVIATGANDVPRYKGGLYWPGDDDQRDHVRGEDSNKVQIEKIVQNIVGRAQTNARRLSESQLENVLRGSRLQDLTEFGRAVHAEMEALLSCARSGVSPRGGVLYCSTFPCHNCAKHIVAAGIERVFYVEPYPKSLAAELHGDAIAVDQATEGRVCFLPFTGIAARRYFDLFSLQGSSGRRVRRKDADGVHKAIWERKAAIPRVPMTPDSYIEREVVANLTIRDTIKKGKANETRKKQHLSS
jgi:deoxycytidylate deaminase